MPRNTTWRMVSAPRLVLEASIALPTPVDPEFWGARNDAHYAAQLIASAGGTLLEADPHFHHSSATLDGTFLVGEVGMTPGDAGIGQPYFYATPWPYPVARATPELSIGRWNTEGWYGAVLEADRITGDSGVATFLLAATAHLIELSEMENPNA